MSTSKVATTPAVLLANDLRDGDVVFLGRDGWTRDPSRALIAQSAALAETMLAHAAAATADNVIVDPYLVEVVLDADGHATPRHFREQFRMLGPSVRRDVGKQADFGLVSIAAE